MLALELVGQQKCKSIRSRSSVSTFKIRNGLPLGCELTLRKKNQQSLSETQKYLEFQQMPASHETLYTCSNANECLTVKMQLKCIRCRAQKLKFPCSKLGDLVCEMAYDHLHHQIEALLFGLHVFTSQRPKSKT